MLSSNTFVLALAALSFITQAAPTNSTSTEVQIIEIANVSKYVCTFPKGSSKTYTITGSEVDKVALMTEGTKTGKSGYPHEFGNGNGLPFPKACQKEDGSDKTVYEYPIYQSAKGHNKQTYWKRDVKKDSADQKYLPPFRIVYTVSDDEKDIVVCFVMTHDEEKKEGEGPSGGGKGDFSFCKEE